MTYRCLLVIGVLILLTLPAAAQDGGLQPYVPAERRGQIDAEREGTHDANRLRTVFSNFGMVGDFEGNPDLTVFHSVEVPKGSGINYSDGITPFVLDRITQTNGVDAYIMETGYRERQGVSPRTGKVMRFEPRPGYFEEDPAINTGRSIAISNDPRTWPGAMDGNPAPEDCWIDKADDPDDPGWCGSWNGFFGKRPNADQESFFVMDDDLYDAWRFFPDSRDADLPDSERRRGLGLRVEVRGFQWSNPQAANVVFWHYDIVNEGTTDYDDIIFGLYMDSGVGGSSVSCDGYGETDDDNAFYTDEFGQDLVYTWDTNGTGVGLNDNCAQTGYLGYAYLETPGNPFDKADNDDDGIVDERREGRGPGDRFVGQDAIRAAVEGQYDVTAFERAIGSLEDRPAYVAGEWWTGDEDLDWVAELHDTGADGVFAEDEEDRDAGELDGRPTYGEPNYDRTDINESDQIGLTGFKLNRIAPGPGASGEVDAITFHTTGAQWPRRLYEQFSDPDPDVRFGEALSENFNIGFLFSSGPFELPAGTRQRFSLALAYGQDLQELEDNVATVQQIYDANYQFAVPPPEPVVDAYVNEDGHVVLSWTNRSEKAVDPVTYQNDFEGYKVYRSTEPNFLDPTTISNARGIEPFPIGAPEATFDLKNDKAGYSNQTVQGVAYYLGEDSGITHTYVDSSVTRGQTYYYAVTAYDHGSDDFGFFPSENAVAVSRTARGGTVLPPNVVEVRPNLKVPGYQPVSFDSTTITHLTGAGTASVDVAVVNDDALRSYVARNAELPDEREMRITFSGQADSVRADAYNLLDVTEGDTTVLFTGGVDFDGEGAGPVGAGLMPVVSTPEAVSVDQALSGFTDGSDTNVGLRIRYVEGTNLLPANLRRPGYPSDLLVTYGDEPLDTTLAAIGAPAQAVQFKIETYDSESGTTGEKLDIRFTDVNDDRMLNAPGEVVEVLTYLPESSRPYPTWNIQVDTTGVNGQVDPPSTDARYEIILSQPVSLEDTYAFRIAPGAPIDQEGAQDEFDREEPYVVPNPYVASASFEPERFAVSGRGERRIEFRAIPAGSTIRIFTIRGELVQTLHHDGSTTGMVPWNLRSKDNLEVAPGLYIFHVSGGADGRLGERLGKFAIIK